MVKHYFLFSLFSCFVVAYYLDCMCTILHCTPKAEINYVSAKLKLVWKTLISLSCMKLFSSISDQMLAPIILSGSDFHNNSISLPNMYPCR